MSEQTTKISKREASALMNSLTAGVVPRIGLRHIAVGRSKEIFAFLRDLETVENGGAAFRLISGQYGSGKSFLLQVIRNNAMERSFVTADADLTPERRLSGGKGYGIATYRELLQNLSTLTRPEGGALESILQRWIAELQREAASEMDEIDQDQLIQSVSEKISAALGTLSEMAYGFSFSAVLDAYWRGMKTGDDRLKQSALRWIRAEYSTKTEAKKDLPVDRIIEDQNWYDFLKLFARFTALAGYQGLLVFLDEGINLYKITNKAARENNYEKLLTIFNDTMQGKARYLGFFMSGTVQFVYDERRGLFSYEALRSRLSSSRFEGKGYVDLTGPVVQLQTLTPEEIYLLLERLCEVHECYYNYPRRIREEDLALFLQSVRGRLGTDKLLTPREITRDFLGLLNILYQNDDVTPEDLIRKITVKSAEADPEEVPDDLADDDDTAAGGLRGGSDGSGGNAGNTGSGGNTGNGGNTGTAAGTGDTLEKDIFSEFDI